MIKFFRKIRQKLMLENKISKYSLYALGEILLVVIGILIALQVNNLNEARKLKAAQEGLLKKLISELEDDIELFHSIDSIYENDLREIEFVIRESLSMRNTSLKGPEQMVAGRGSTLYLTVNESTFEELINTGLLYQLNDEALKKRIVSYYTVADFLLEKENRDNQNLNNWLLGIKEVDPKRLIMRLREGRNLDMINWDWLQDPNSPMYREIETQVIWTKAAIGANREVMERIKRDSRKLQKQILTYLEQ